MNHKPMLNAYPDSLGGNLGDIVTLLKLRQCRMYFLLFTFCRACIIPISTGDFP